MTPFSNGAAQFEFHMNDTSCTTTIKKQRKKRTSPQRAAVEKMMHNLEEQMQEYLSGCCYCTETIVPVRCHISLSDILNNE